MKCWIYGRLWCIDNRELDKYMKTDKKDIHIHNASCEPFFKVHVQEFHQKREILEFT